MAYARLSGHSPIEALDEKEHISIWPPRNLSRLFSYKTLFGASLALWIATSATFGWLLANRPSEYGNYAATPMPFPRGMTHVKRHVVSFMLTEMSSAITRRHVRTKRKISLHRNERRRACLVGADAQ